MTPDDFLAVAAGMTDMVGALAPIREAVAAYRDDLVARGFSSPAADQMAVDWHRTLMAQLCPTGGTA